MVSLVCSQDGGIPLLEQTLKGNTSDTKHFREVLSSLRKEMQAGGEPEYYVVDAAMYNESTVKTLGDETKWLSRVPASLKEVRNLICDVKRESLEELEECNVPQKLDSVLRGKSTINLRNNRGVFDVQEAATTFE